MRLNNSVTASTTGSILVSGVDVLTADESEVRRVRGITQWANKLLRPIWSIIRQLQNLMRALSPSRC
jgi:ABC-type glutathione transport system ATPase component